MGGRACGASRVVRFLWSLTLRVVVIPLQAVSYPGHGPHGTAGPAGFIVRNMDRAITTRACVVAWLLCAVLIGLAIHSPHCDRCDSPYFSTSSLLQQPVANHPLPSAPDNCNGICWCCGFHWLPNASPVLTLANNVTMGVWPEPVSPVLAQLAPIFRPPRTAISS
jgi:hypothetical protein